MNKTRRCSDCVAFDHDTKTCRYNPPVVSYDGGFKFSGWPTIVDPVMEWCISFIPIPPIHTADHYLKDGSNT